MFLCLFHLPVEVGWGLALLGSGMLTVATLWPRRGGAKK